MAQAVLHQRKKIKRWSACALMLAVLTTAGADAFGQTRPGGADIVLPGRDYDVLQGATIARVEVKGASRTPIEVIMAVVRVQEGQLYSRAQLEVDVRNVAALQRFKSVRGDVIATTDKPPKVVVQFVVEERETINTVDIVGNRNIEKETLRELLIMRAGATYEPFIIEQDKQAIVNAYVKEGYSHAVVEVDKEAWTKKGVLNYVVTEGPRVTVDNVIFQGNAHLAADLFKSKINTKPYQWIFQKGLLNKDMVESDVTIIQDQYRRRGYIDVQVGYALDYSPDKRRVTVRFVIIEGQRYLVANVLVEGAKVFSEDEIRSDISVRAGEYIDRDKLEKSQKKIEDRYGHEGYIFRKVDVTTAYTERPGEVNVVFRIDENKAYTINQIIIRGNQNTQDRVIRRQLRIYPDQTFDSVQVRKSVDRLKAQSGLYSDVRISPVNVGNDTASALVDVLEGQSGKISVGAGLSSNSGLIGQLSLEQKNFDWTAWPTSWEELISGKAFKGAGQSMLIQLEPGTELQRYRMRFEEPSLYDTIYSFANDLYYFTRERESYDEKRIGDVITLGRRFGDVWSASVSLRAEQVTIEQVEDVNNDGVSQSGYFLLNNAGKVYGPFSDSAQQILDEVGDHFIVSIKPAIVRDTTDSRVFPSDGTRFTFSWEQYGGDLSMSKIVSRFDWYYTLNTDLFDRKTVFVMRNEVGVIFGDSVFYERFYGGGTGSLRGFRFRGVGPREGGLKDPVGGDFSWVTTMEVNFPIYENMIRGVFFVDVGTVEKDITISTIRADVGFGARVKLNFFGELPLALDFAFPISKANGDETQFLSFSLGIPY